MTILVMYQENDVYGHYKASICSRWKDEYLQFLNSYMEKGMKYPHELSYYLIGEFPSLAINGLKENILYESSRREMGRSF